MLDSRLCRQWEEECLGTKIPLLGADLLGLVEGEQVDCHTVTHLGTQGRAAYQPLSSPGQLTS
jgi:hypothetical protein